MFPSDLPSPLIFAHRGASFDAPENTLASFQLALETGAHGIELDAKLSADGHVVVIHDQTVDRTTDGHGAVRRLSLAQLKGLDAGSWFDSPFRGERIPSLREVFSVFGQRLYINIELTNYASPFDILVPKVVALVKKFGLEDRVLFSSFLPHNLSLARRLLPEVPRGLLSYPGWKGDWQRLFGRLMNLQSEHPFVGDVTARYVDSIHRRRRRVFAYTVDSPADMRRLFALGADGFFTNDPALALRVLVGQDS